MRAPSLCKNRRLCPGDSVAVMPGYGADPQVAPYLLYEDAGAAMDWLIRVSGFTERVRDRQGDGTVRHGELLLGDGGVIMLGYPERASGDLPSWARSLSCSASRSRTCWRTVSVRRRRAPRYPRSRCGPTARAYTVDDPEGHRWYFSEPP